MAAKIDQSVFEDLLSALSEATAEMEEVILPHSVVVWAKRLLRSHEEPDVVIWFRHELQENVEDEC